MSATTGIEWTDRTWNPVVGCAKVSAGCKNCYAKTLHDQRHKAYHAGKKVPAQYAQPFEVVQLMPDRLRDPLSWKKPCRVFVNSVSDLFHEDVPDEFLDRCFAVMALAKQHTFQVLTKRPERMAAYLNRIQNDDRDTNAWQIAACDETTGNSPCACNVVENCDWPLPNVWLGVSVENQTAADERIPHLLATPASVRFLSCEPLLGPVNLSKYLACPHCGGTGEVAEQHDFATEKVGCRCMGEKPLHWVITGGESGPGARPMQIEWARDLVRQCKAADTPVFVKQLGAHPEGAELLQPTGRFRTNDTTGKRQIELRMIVTDPKGGDPAQWPEDLRVREFPQ